MIAAVIWLFAFVLLILAVRRTRGKGRRGGVGSAAVGVFYDAMTDERRNAVEVILEERAEARDPEDKDGDLPQLANPRKNPRRAGG